MASLRAQCAFTAGALVRDTLGISDEARVAIPIKHIIVMMKENRGFDHLLGRLPEAGKPAVDGTPPTFSNPEHIDVAAFFDAGGVDAGPIDGGAVDAGDAVAPFHQTTTCIRYDPGHQWPAMHAQVDYGAMDGFISSAARTTGTDGFFAMSYYDETDFPFYYWLAKTYALNDRHFASVRSGTYPNRNFMLLGTADGVTSTGAGYPKPSTPTLFDAMDRAGVSWGAYSDGSLVGGTLAWTAGHPHTGAFATFLQLLDSGTLPQVVFVDGIDNVTDDHPTADVQVGEAWSRTIYEHAVASSLWSNLAILWLYDEGGGFFDHVPPPDMACIARPANPIDAPFFELGVRVPMTVISPYARAGYTSHVVQEHTAVTRFIETLFNIPALTSRDANSDALLDLFDFQCPPALLKPPPAPAAGTHGCH
jgi:phospholipase C